MKLGKRGKTKLLTRFKMCTTRCLWTRKCTSSWSCRSLESSRKIKMKCRSQWTWTSFKNSRLITLKRSFWTMECRRTRSRSQIWAKATSRSFSTSKTSKKSFTPKNQSWKCSRSWRKGSIGGGRKDSRSTSMKFSHLLSLSYPILIARVNSASMTSTLKRRIWLRLEKLKGKRRRSNPSLSQKGVRVPTPKAS